MPGCSGVPPVLLLVQAEEDFVPGFGDLGVQPVVGRLLVRRQVLDPPDPQDVVHPLPGFVGVLCPG